MATLVSLSPDPILRFTDTAGNPLVGGMLTTTVGGILFQTYSEATGTFPLPNPIILNDRGEVATNVGTSTALYLVPSVSYTFQLQDALGSTIWTVPNIVGEQTPGTVTALITSIVTASYIGNLIYTSTVEPLLGITPLFPQYPESDIRRYGADTTAADNSGAINTALLVNSHGGNAVFIPAGNWNITSTLVANSSAITGNTSMYGVGLASNIIPTGCDGLSFTNGQAANAASRFFRDFSITGPSATTSSNNGITINLSANKIVGVQFSNLTIQNFAKGVFVNGATGLWNSAFVDCWIANCYQGYYIFGQAILLNIRGGFVSFAGGTMTGVGTRNGFFAQDNAGGNLQSLHMQGLGIYNYDNLISLINPVYVAIENCDLSLFGTCGVFIGGRTGTFVVRDCWIQAITGATNCAGIFVEDLGTPLLDKIIIDGNSLYGSIGAGTCGVYLGGQAGPVSVTNNTIGSAATPFTIGVGGQTPGALGVSAVGGNGVFSPNSVIANNTITAQTTAVVVQSVSTGITVTDNITSGIPIAFSNPSVTPTNFTYRAPGMKGTVSFVAATSVLVIFPQTLPSAGYFVSMGGNAAGYCWPTAKSANGFTINCSNSNSNSTDWAVSYN